MKCSMINSTTFRGRFAEGPATTLQEDKQYLENIGNALTLENIENIEKIETGNIGQRGQFVRVYLENKIAPNISRDLEFIGQDEISVHAHPYSICSFDKNIKQLQPQINGIVTKALSLIENTTLFEKYLPKKYVNQFLRIK